MSRRRTPRQLEQRPVSVHPDWCPSGKVGWYSREDAERAVTHLQAVREDGARIEKRSYRCSSCSRHHLTSDSHKQAS